MGASQESHVSAYLDELSVDDVVFAARGEGGVVFWGQVDVFEALLRVGGSLPRDPEEREDFLGDAQTRARVGGQVDPGHFELSGQLGSSQEQLVFSGAERTNLF